MSTTRITNLDLLRGMAVLGILVMNAVSYGLAPAAYHNLAVDARSRGSTGASESPARCSSTRR